MSLHIKTQSTNNQESMKKHRSIVITLENLRMY